MPKIQYHWEIDAYKLSVEAAMEIGIGSLPDPVVLVNQVVIPQLHPEMGENLLVSGYFAERIGREKGW